MNDKERRALGEEKIKDVYAGDVIVPPEDYTFTDVPGRLLTSPAETPIGVVTAFIGAPFFIYLLRTRKLA